MKLVDCGIDDSRPVFVIAEVGSNHGGSVDEAHRYIDAAADCGASAVKFQTIRLERFLADRVRVDGKEADGPRTSARFASLPDSAWSELFSHARERNLEGFTACFDTGAVEIAVGAGARLLKVASGDVTNTQLLRTVGTTGLPVILSTGMSTLAEVARAIELLVDAGSEPPCLLHCVSEYPTSAEKMNVRAVASLRSEFGVPTGLSDHTLSNTTSLAAVALGARVLERHVTFSRSADGVDHHFALEIEQFRELIVGVREVEACLGSGDKAPTAAEMERRSEVRRGLYAEVDLAAGSVIRAGDVIALRPLRDYVPASELDALEGRVMRRDLKAGLPLMWSDLA